MTGKRPYRADGEDGDSKRIRSSNGSPVAAPSKPNAESLQERMAALKAKLAASKQNAAPPPAPASPSLQSASSAAARPVMGGTPAAGVDLEAQKAAAQKKIAEIRAQMAARRQASTGTPVNAGSTASPPPPPQSEKEARIAEARARAAKVAEQRNIAPSVPTPPPRQDGRTAKGGLGIGLHPSLMGDLTAPSLTKGKSSLQQGPKFSSTKGNRVPDLPKANPYLPAQSEEREEERTGEGYDATIATRKADRQSKQLVFNEKGKFMAQANALRQQARLEEMKRRIAQEARKVQIEEASDKSFLVPAPPEVEWWDEGLLPSGQNSYEGCLEDGRNKIETADSIITALIQRPVLLQAPQDRFAPAPKPLMLTKVEQKKLRRQRRMADMKEEQAKIRLGLIEPPPPKVKKSNMMTVLGEQAVKDPTAVEARVNREIAQRQNDHERANEERKLTKEQRAEKIKQQQAGDEARGVKVAVFKVDNLSSGKHRYQIDVNAKQNALTGMVVLHPTMNLIIVEGGTHSIQAYKKLMLNRIKWSENTLPLSNANPTTFTQPAPSASVAADGGANKAAQWCNPLDEDGQLKDLSENRCVLVWEGDELARAFRRWGSKAVETDGEARDVLGRQKMENMWTLARSK